MSDAVLPVLTNGLAYAPQPIGTAPMLPTNVTGGITFAPEHLKSPIKSKLTDSQYLATGVSMKPPRIANALRRAATEPAINHAVDELTEAKKTNKPFAELSANTQSVVQYVEQYYASNILTERRVRGAVKAQKDAETWEKYPYPVETRLEEKKSRKKKPDPSEEKEIRTIIFKRVPRKDKSGKVEEGKFVEKRKPKPYVVDPYSDLKPGDHSRSLKLISKIQHRFGENSHIAATIFCDALIREMFQVSIETCKKANKHTIQVAHLFASDLSKTEYIPIVANYKSWRKMFSNYEKGETGRNRPDEARNTDRHKHPLEYNVNIVGKSVIGQLKEKANEKEKVKIQTSSEFKQLCCNILDEFLSKLGAILNSSLMLRDVKTVSVEMFYETLNTLAIHSDISFAKQYMHIKECMKAFDDYELPEDDEDESE